MFVAFFRSGCGQCCSDFSVILRIAPARSIIVRSAGEQLKEGRWIRVVSNPTAAADVMRMCVDWSSSASPVSLVASVSAVQSSGCRCTAARGSKADDAEERSTGVADSYISTRLRTLRRGLCSVTVRINHFFWDCISILIAKFWEFRRRVVVHEVVLLSGDTDSGEHDGASFFRSPRKHWL